MNRKNCVSGIFWTLFFLFFLYLDVQMGENASYWPGIIAKLGKMCIRDSYKLCTQQMFTGREFLP